MDELERKSPFSRHLEELRLRLIYSIIFLVAGSAAGFFVTDKFLFTWLLGPIVSVPDVHLQVLGPFEKLYSFFKTSFIVGIVIAFPFIFHQVWLFLKPGLKPVERQYLLLLIPSSVLLFTAGAAFAFFVMIPAALRFGIGIDFGVEIEAGITLETYFSFMLSLLLAGGLIFQIPLVAFFLAKAGLVSAHYLSRHRKHAIIITILLAAIITPTGDLFNLALLAVPMYVLFEISVIIAALTYRDRKNS